MASPPGNLYARGFAADAATERALRTGLAGREAKVQRGSMATALRALAAEPSPRVVFVDFDGVSEPGAAARELAAVCAIGTALIAIGSTDTAHRARSLLRHGIADYLVKPISPSVVRDASAAALDDLPERTYAGNVVAFAGTAGSGVSTLVAQIARGVKANGRTVLVVDLDPWSRTLSVRLRAGDAKGDLAALIALLESGAGADTAGEESADPALDPGPMLSHEQVDAICASAAPGISVITYSRAKPLPPPPSARAVGLLLGQLANRAHVVLVTGVVDPGTQTEIMRGADARVLLFEPTLSSISTAVHCLALLGSDCPSTLVQCHPRMRRSALSPAQIRYALAERHPDIVIPFDPALHATATGEGKERPPGKAYRAALGQVLERIVKAPVSSAT